MRTKETFLAFMFAAILAIAALSGCGTQNTGNANTTGNSNENTPAATSTAGDDAASGDVQFTLYLGTNDKDTNKPVYSKDECKERAKAILMDKFGGYTIQEAEGGWKGDDGKEYQEYTLVIYLSDTDIDTVHDAADELIKEFNQSSVLINTSTVETEFYSG